MEPITGTGSISPESVSATNNGHQPVKQLQQSHVPSRGEEKVTANIIDNIPVFCRLWRSHVLLRRIDSDYGKSYIVSWLLLLFIADILIVTVNVTSVCRALQATRVLAEFLKLPGAAIVEGNKNETVNGIWVHHTFVAGWVEQLGISDDLVKEFLNINLANRVSPCGPQKISI
jgi:hypothetical protein